MARNILCRVECCAVPALLVVRKWRYQELIPALNNFHATTFHVPEVSPRNADLTERLPSTRYEDMVDNNLAACVKQSIVHF